MNDIEHFVFVQCKVSRGKDSDDRRLALKKVTWTSERFIRINALPGMNVCYYLL